MVWIFLLLIVLSSIILGILVLVQNSKGGGLSGSFSGFNTQLLGVKKTSDVLENGTWLFAAIIAILCLTSSFFIGRETSTGGPLDKASSARPQTQQMPAANGGMQQQQGTPAGAQQGAGAGGQQGGAATPKP